MDVAVIGAGPGGLALALGLQTVAPSLNVKVCCGASSYLATSTHRSRDGTCMRTGWCIGDMVIFLETALYKPTWELRECCELQVYEKAKELHPIGACIVRPCSSRLAKTVL